MVKNDYRRSLIMLRPHAQGYSGHVRLERRTLMGSMYFVIGVPSSEGTLCATLVRRDAQGTYFAVRLGELRRDGRGQATLAHAFDPRNIDGRTLEDYLLITVVHSGPEGCDVVLSGNVNGSQEVNWNSVRAASCAVCAPPREPACDLCPPPPEPRQENEEKGEEELPEECEDSREDSEEESEEESEEKGSESSGECAGDHLGVDMSAPWPGVSEQLRALFAQQPARELMLGDGCTYVSAPMPAGSGYDHVEIGVRERNGVLECISYALPSRYSPEPPPGLEDYRWKGGASEGWWTVYTDPATGEILH